MRKILHFPNPPESVYYAPTNFNAFILSLGRVIPQDPLVRVGSTITGTYKLSLENVGLRYNHSASQGASIELSGRKSSIDSIEERLSSLVKEHEEMKA